MALKIQDVKPLPAVTRDRPTSARPETPASKSPAEKKPAARKPRTPTDPLASAPRTITNRVPGALWDELSTRANDLGIPLRVLLTDAISRALEQTPEDHLAAAKATRRRERLARANADD